MMRYFGLLDSKNNLLFFTENGILLKFLLENKSKKEILEVINYSCYIFNLTYHLIIDLLFDIKEKELSGSTNFFSIISVNEQLNYILNKINQNKNIDIDKRALWRFTYFIREIGVITKKGFIPELRDNIWRGIFLLSFSDVARYFVNKNNDFILTPRIVDEIRAPLFLSKSGFYSQLEIETLYPFFEIDSVKMKEYKIHVNSFINPTTIINKKL